MNARKRKNDYRVGVLQRRAYLTSLLLDSIKRNGSGTLSDFIARFPNFTAIETKRALDYLHEVNIIQRVPKEYGTLWVLERKENTKMRRTFPKEEGTRAERFAAWRCALPEYDEKAAGMIARAESKPDRWERQEAVLKRFNWSRASIEAGAVRRAAALRCLLFFGKWINVNDVAEKVGGVGHQWQPTLRSLVADGLVSMKYATRGGCHTCLYKIPDANGVETPRSFKRDSVKRAISEEWQDVYTLAEIAGVSEEYVRYVIKRLVKEGGVEKRALTGMPHQWRWKVEKKGALK